MKIAAAIILGLLSAKLSFNISTAYDTNIWHTSILVLTYVLSLCMMTTLSYRMIRYKKERHFTNFMTLPVPILICTNAALLIILMIKNSSPWLMVY